MTSPTEPSSEELRILLIRYLEGSLSPREEDQVSGYLRTSERASSELKGLRGLLDTLKTDKTVFCPELSDISELVATGHDATGKIARHLKECISCRKEAKALKYFHPASSIPPEIWQVVKARLSQRGKKSLISEERAHSSGLLAWLSFAFRRPAMAIAAAAAVVLLAVFLIPVTLWGPIVALSSGVLGG